MKTIKERDRLLEEAWEELGNIPVDDNGILQEMYLISIPEENCAVRFDSGTDREEVWKWFDEHYSQGVADLLYHKGKDVAEELAEKAAQLMVLQLACRECLSDTCAFNPDGICKFPLVYGRKPRLWEEGCASWTLGDVEDRRIS